MSDLAEFYKDQKAAYKERCQKRNEKYEFQLIELGAIFKSDGVYELNDWFLYPTKGFAMNKKNSKKRMSLDKFIQKQKNIN